MQVDIMEDDILSGYLKCKHCYAWCQRGWQSKSQGTPKFLPNIFLMEAWADISFSCVGGQPIQQKYGFLNMPVPTLCHPVS